MGGSPKTQSWQANISLKSVFTKNMTCSYGRSGHIHCRIFSETCHKSRVSSKTDFRQKSTYSEKIATPTRMGPGVQGPNGGPKISLMYIFIIIYVYIYRYIYIYITIYFSHARNRQGDVQKWLLKRYRNLAPAWDRAQLRPAVGRRRRRGSVRGGDGMMGRSGRATAASLLVQGNSATSMHAILQRRLATATEENTRC